MPGAHQRRGEARVVDVRAGPAQQVAVEDEQAHAARDHICAPDVATAPLLTSARRERRPEIPPARAVHRPRDDPRGRARQGLRRPGDGRAARGRRASSCRSPPRPRTCPGRSRTCGSATGATPSRRRTSTTVRRAAGAWTRSAPDRRLPLSMPLRLSLLVLAALLGAALAVGIVACGGGDDDDKGLSRPELSAPSSSSRSTASTAGRRPRPQAPPATRDRAPARARTRAALTRAASGSSGGSSGSGGSDDSGGSGGSQAPSDDSGGGGSPSPNSPAGRFEKYCRENPGAC